MSNKMQWQTPVIETLAVSLTAADAVDWMDDSSCDVLASSVDVMGRKKPPHHHHRS